MLCRFIKILPEILSLLLSRNLIFLNIMQFPFHNHFINCQMQFGKERGITLLLPQFIADTLPFHCRYITIRHVD